MAFVILLSSKRMQSTSPKTNKLKATIKLVKVILTISWLIAGSVFLIISLLLFRPLAYQKTVEKHSIYSEKTIFKIDTNFTNLWTAPAEWRLSKLGKEEKKRIAYGKQLIAHTSEYLGPKGSVARNSNG